MFFLLYNCDRIFIEILIYVLFSCTPSLFISKEVKRTLCPFALRIFVFQEQKQVLTEEK